LFENPGRRADAVQGSGFNVGLRVVVLCGRKAHAGWDRAQLTVDLPVLRVPHPSARWLNAHPEDRDKIVAALVEARRLAYQDE
jgi:hypothetical protein